MRPAITINEFTETNALKGVRLPAFVGNISAPARNQTEEACVISSCLVIGIGRTEQGPCAS